MSRHLEEGIKNLSQALRSFLPIGQVVATGRKALCLQFVEKALRELPQWRVAVSPPDKECDGLMAERNQPPYRGKHRRHMVRAAANLLSIGDSGQGATQSRILADN